MKIQIYTMQSVEEALAVIAEGVDHVGITPSDIGLPGEVDVHTARAIVEAVGDGCDVLHILHRFLSHLKMKSTAASGAAGDGSITRLPRACT